MTSFSSNIICCSFSYFFGFSFSFLSKLLLKNSLLSSILAKEIANTAFTFVITTPAVYTPTCSQCNCMVLATGNLGHLFVTFRPDDSRWSTYVLFVTNTQLAMVIKAPSEYLTFHVFVE